MRYRSLVFGLVATMWSCGGGPTTPSTPVAPTRPTSSLSGLVFAVTQTGLQSVAGAKVRLEIGSFRQDAMSDGNGVYMLSELYDGSSSISTSKDGYDTDTRTVSIRGDTQLDIRVVRTAKYTLSGVVSEMTSSGPAPVENVRVHWSDTHVDYITDTNGFYSVPGVTNGIHTFVVGKEGYQEVVRNVTISGDTRLDMQIIRR